MIIFWHDGYDGTPTFVPTVDGMLVDVQVGSVLYKVRLLFLFRARSHV